MRPFLSTFSCFLLGILLAGKAYATHVRAGEITAVRDISGGNQNSLKYIFTFTMYRDTCPGCVPAGKATLFFGSGTNSGPVDPVSREMIGNQTEKVTYTFMHTYTAPGIYVVHVTVDNRNDNVLNMYRSVDTPFHVKTTLFINQSVGINDTPVLLNAPVDMARVGQKFIHNPGASDSDGDMLRFRLTTPQQGFNKDVTNYRDPQLVQPPGRSESGGPATFTIDSLTGQLEWDSPALPGIYNVAFVVEEWRNGVKIGEVVRDMQIIVRDNPNNRPELKIPNDTCIVAGSFLSGVATATDEDTNRIRLTASSGLFQTNFPVTRPSFTVPALVQVSPATGEFRWENSGCVHVRKEPYQVVFRAEDLPGSGGDTTRKLVDIKVWQIRVVGPRPTGLRVTPQGANVQLSWEAYSCENAVEMIVYRRVGCSEIDTSACNTGLDASSGYVEIGRVPIGTTSFIDTNGGQGLEPGVSYSYRIVAGFAPPQGGESLASAQACTALSLEMPFITHVDVEQTSPAQGEIEVRWIQPLELDTKANPGPYRYELYRGNGLQGGALQLLESKTYPTISSANDTVFTDRGLNTVDSAYHYVLLFYTGGSLKDSTQSASSVRLSATRQVNAIELSWQAVVPWSNANTTHKVYRESPTAKGSFELIASVEVGAESTFRFTDRGNGVVLDEDSLYCYYVETSGSYSNEKLPSPLLNKSQLICASPLDTLKPCPPLLSINELECEAFVADKSNCNVSSFSNRLSWEPAALTAGCDEDVAGFRLYYKRYEEDESYSLIASLPAAAGEYVHGGLSSFAGCYYITAVDEDGQESEQSNEVCKDNCPYYELPNVITVNGDEKNELFRPFACPLFVEKVSIEIHNRWGRSVFSSEDNIFINWDGTLRPTETSVEGQVSTGVYYYLAEVRFARLRRQNELVKIKGWIHVLK